MHDSGTRRQFENGALRDGDRNKPMLELASPLVELRVGNLRRGGAEKYSPRNWEKGMPLSVYMGSCLRHLAKYRAGMEDEDHLAASIWNLESLMHTEICIDRGWLPKHLDDLPRYEKYGTEYLDRLQELDGTASTPVGDYVDGQKGECCYCDPSSIEVSYASPPPPRNYFTSGVTFVVRVKPVEELDGLDEDVWNDLMEDFLPDHRLLLVSGTSLDTAEITPPSALRDMEISYLVCDTNVPLQFDIYEDTVYRGADGNDYILEEGRFLPRETKKVERQGSFPEGWSVCQVRKWKDLVSEFGLNQNGDIEYDGGVHLYQMEASLDAHRLVLVLGKEGEVQGAMQTTTVSPDLFSNIIPVGDDPMFGNGEAFEGADHRLYILNSSSFERYIPSIEDAQEELEKAMDDFGLCRIQATPADDADEEYKHRVIMDVLDRWLEEDNPLEVEEAPETFIDTTILKGVAFQRRLSRRAPEEPSTESAEEELS